MTEQVTRLFDPKQPEPTITDVGPTFIEVARNIAQICATRILLMIAVLAGSGIWVWTIADPSRDRLYAAIAFSVVFLGPLTALYARKG